MCMCIIGIVHAPTSSAVRPSRSGFTFPSVNMMGVTPGVQPKRALCCLDGPKLLQPHAFLDVDS
jgi:hypothetical protein